MLRPGDTINTRRTRIRFAAKRLPQSTRLVLVLLTACVLLAMFAATGSMKSGPAITMRTAGHVNARLNLRDGQELKVEYRGELTLAEALQNGKARPRALGLGDFDIDGAPDLVSGYSYFEEGIVTLQRGNPDAYAPKDDSVFQRMQKGYDPPLFLTEALAYRVPEPVDFLLVGDFNRDGFQDVLTAARGGGLYLLAGNGAGLGAPEQIALSGKVTALTAGQFGRRSEGMKVVVGTDGADGPAVLVFSAAGAGLRSTTEMYRLPAVVTSLALGRLDGDSFYDLAVVAGTDVEIIHGHGEKASVSPESRMERLNLPFAVRAMALGDFTWDREGRTEMAVLAENGTVHLLQRGPLDTRPFTEEEQDARLAEAMSKVGRNQQPDTRIEEALAWQPGINQEWTIARQLDVPMSLSDKVAPQALLARSRVSSQPADDLLMLDPEGGQVHVIEMTAGQLRGKANTESVRANPPAPVTMDVIGTPVAVIDLPHTVNGRHGLALLRSESVSPSLIPLAPLATFTVTRTDDRNTSCTSGVDCSLREAISAVNSAGAGQVINFSFTGTITLTSTLPTITNTDVTITGPGAGSLTVDQASAGNSRHIRDTSGGTFSVSGLTFTGGSGFTFGGGSMLCGGTTSVNNHCTFTSVTFKNNSSAKSDNTTGTSGGAIANGAGGSLTITNCTFGGPNASDANTAFNNVGGAIAFDQSGVAGDLSITGTTFQGNIASSAGTTPVKPQGGAIDMNTDTGNESVQNCTFLSNQAQGTGGNAGIGGGIFVGNGNGTTNINLNRFLGNTAPGGGGAVWKNANPGGAVATNNWWGCDDFPGGTGCDTSFPTTNTPSPGANQIQFDPRIDLALTASPATVCRSSNSTITADVTKNTNNANVNGGNAPTVLVGLTVTFGGSLNGGMITAPSGPIPVGGTVAKTFTAGSGHGAAMPSVLLDNGTAQTVTVTVPDSFSSFQTGQFGTAATWTPACVPQSDDSVTILNTHTVTLPADSNIADVTINAGGILNTSTFNLTVNSTNNLKNYASVNSWTNNGTLSGTGTVIFTGNNLTQTLSGPTTFNNLTINHTGSGNVSFAGSSSSSIGNQLTLTNGALSIGANTLTINGAISATSGTLTGGATSNITFGGAGASTTLPAVTNDLNNLTINRANGITLGANLNVAGTLALSGGDLTTTGSFTLTQPSSAPASTGTLFDVIGNVKRTNSPSPLPSGTGLTFGNQNNIITFTAAVTRPTDVTVNLDKHEPGNLNAAPGFPNAVARTYTITQNGGVGFNATLRLHYLDAELLHGNVEGPTLNLWQFNGVGWAPRVQTGNDTTNNWVEKSGILSFSSWTFNSTLSPTASNGSVSGRITTGDGSPVAGAVIYLSGPQNRKTITDANGNYHFDNVETDAFYTVTPSRANFTFSPATRSFSQSGSKTEASFTGADNGDSANPLDASEYFVRQQYVDLLGREPDESGFNYWSDQINQCGNDADCIRSRRISVAAAFFIEQEFQASGSFIYDLYQGALGRKPAFSEYSADRQQVVGGANLETEKAAFANNFVQRAEFVAKYQATVSADSFVDALIQNVQTSGVDLSGARANLINVYNGGGSTVESRALVVRAIADDATFKQREYNSAFVLTEYFSYLRRDSDQGGYDFWLNVLNNGDPGNYRGMVCSFITSTEYQRRFSGVVSHSNSECGQ